MIDAYLKRIAETQKIRNSFKRNALIKLWIYPFPLLIFKAIEQFYPGVRQRIWVQNTLFFNERFYTLGYWIDYFLCGFLVEDYEVRLTKFLIQSIKEDDVFFDVGAHYGFYTLLAHKIISQLKAGGGGRNLPSIYAFEPTPENYQVLLENTAGKNISVYQIGLFSKIGTFEFLNFSGIHKTQNSLCTTLAAEKVGLIKFNSIQINTTTLDEFCSQYKIVPTIIKMDIEGSEYDVICGGIQILKLHKPAIIMEIWGKGYNERHLKAAELLLSIGYQAYRIDPSGKPEPITIKYISEFERFAVDNIVFLNNE